VLLRRSAARLALTVLCGPAARCENAADGYPRKCVCRRVEVVAKKAHRFGASLSNLESFGSGACVKLRLFVVKSPDICLPKGVACAPFAGVLADEEV
jgi:hypothetical protein